MLTGDVEADANDGADRLGSLGADLKIAGLAAYGVTAADLPSIAAKSAKASSMKGNPTSLDPGELFALLATAL